MSTGEAHTDIAPPPPWLVQAKARLDGLREGHYIGNWMREGALRVLAGIEADEIPAPLMTIVRVSSCRSVVLRWYHGGRTLEVTPYFEGPWLRVSVHYRGRAGERGQDVAGPSFVPVVRACLAKVFPETVGTRWREGDEG